MLVRMATDTSLVESRLKALVAGKITVVDVDVEAREEPDRSYLLIQLRLSEPEGETWDVDDFYSVRSQARTTVTSLIDPDRDFELSYVTGSASADDQVEPDLGSSSKHAEVVNA